jgi:hypothetical protein
MNILLLLAGVRAWSGSPVEILTRVFCAVALFALEMQVVTWTDAASLSSLVPLNAVVAAGLFIWFRRRDTNRVAEPQDAATAPRQWLPFAASGVLVLLLNGLLPLEAADPYHLERIGRIEQLGTLAYDRDADARGNVMGWLYELVLADLGALPVAGPVALKFHGVIGLVLYALMAAAILQIAVPPLQRASRGTAAGTLRGRGTGPGAPPASIWLLAVIPVAFHQLVMVKNDLFGAVPAALVLAWIAARGREAVPAEGAWAGWLTGIAVGIKLTSAPIAFVFGAALLADHRRSARMLALAIAGGIVGLVAAGMLFLLVENHAVYGSSVAPYAELGNRNAGIGEAAVSIGRFGISLVDMGLVTRRLWPGRGGWGGTYGLPVIWALCVLSCAWRTPLAQRTLIACGVYWVAFAAAYPDADVGVVAVAAAAAVSGSEPSVPPWLRRLAWPVVVLSGLQIVRSALLYLARA